MRRRTRLVLLALVVASLLAQTRRDARAQSVITSPGDHPRYFVELEPEVILSFGRSLTDDGPGAGVRASIPIVHNGFISSINNSVAITFGFDKDPLFRGDVFYVPVALQWNFWLASHWSVMGEPGMFLQIDDGHVRPYLALWAGGRYHFTEKVALTMRISLPNLPAFSLGPSFLF
jgi:hypothetical protein